MTTHRESIQSQLLMSTRGTSIWGTWELTMLQKCISKTCNRVGRSVVLNSSTDHVYLLHALVDQAACDLQVLYLMCLSWLIPVFVLSLLSQQTFPVVSALQTTYLHDVHSVVTETRI